MLVPMVDINYDDISGVERTIDGFVPITTYSSLFSFVIKPEMFEKSNEVEIDADDVFAMIGDNVDVAIQGVYIESSCQNVPTITPVLEIGESKSLRIKINDELLDEAIVIIDVVTDYSKHINEEVTASSEL